MLKRHLLLITLVFSLLINAAGIFFFIAFLETRGHLRHVKKERNIATQNLFMMRGQVRTNSVMASDDVIKCTFVSHFDGQVDKFAYLPPSNLKTTGGFKLIVYLHGMGSTFLEPFISPETQSVASEIRNNNPDLVFASVNYRGGVAWISDAAMADISQNIRELMQRYPISKIVMMGTSMGGTISLTYAAIAPPDIKSKIIGVVSSEGAGDLAEVYRLTENQSLKPALANAFGGPPEAVPERYARRSLLPNI
ncbi:MAG TPA: alpha/beta fold hydrolase, partial [Candidatus Obscuribacterales bacterium]